MVAMLFVGALFAVILYILIHVLLFARDLLAGSLGVVSYRMPAVSALRVPAVRACSRTASYAAAGCILLVLAGSVGMLWGFSQAAQATPGSLHLAAEGELNVIYGHKVLLIGYADRDGRTVIKPRFNAGKPFSEGLAAVCKGCDWGYIDGLGQTAIPFKFCSANSFREGTAVVALAEGYYAEIDKEGRILRRLRCPQDKDRAKTPSEPRAAR